MLTFLLIVELVRIGFNPFFSTTLRPLGGVENVDLSTDNQTEFVHPVSATGFVANNRLLTAAFCVLSEQHGVPIGLSDLVYEACTILNDTSDEAVQKMFLNNAINLMLSGALNVASDPGGHTAKVSERPEVWPDARYLCKVKTSIPNVLHEAEELGEDLRAMLPYADGTRSVDEITSELMEHFVDGRLSFHLDGKLISKKEELSSLLRDHFRAMLKFLALRAYLVN
jgi:methyltransferase-like protein